MTITRESTKEISLGLAPSADVVALQRNATWANITGGSSAPSAFASSGSLRISSGERKIVALSPTHWAYDQLIRGLKATSALPHYHHDFSSLARFCTLQRVVYSSSRETPLQRWLHPDPALLARAAILRLAKA